MILCAIEIGWVPGIKSMQNSMSRSGGCPEAHPKRHQDNRTPLVFSGGIMGHLAFQ
jgi:hypothetical protein